MHLFSKLSGEILSLLRALGDTAESTNSFAYIIGDFPRSLIINEDCSDIEVTVTGNTGLFIDHFLQNYIPAKSKKISQKERFKIIQSPYSQDMNIHIAQTRKNEHGGAGNINSEIISRGFSIDALAVSLTSREFGTIIDFAGATRDINAGILRVINKDIYSRVPLMIIKTAYYLVKYNLATDPVTDALWLRAIKGNGIKNCPVKELNAFIDNIKKDKCGRDTIKLLKQLKIL
ncbi:MAG: hypothetical protein JXA66_03920 [Oligoflexia bacterium]|nr:hypothetical protein [Oligoflexia bacterium]